MDRKERSSNKCIYIYVYIHTYMWLLVFVFASWYPFCVGEERETKRSPMI